MPGDKIDKIEKQKRIREVMDLILDDWSSGDIVIKIIEKWHISSRQAKRYLAEARENWLEEDQLKIDKKKRLKIEMLKRLKRSLKSKYEGRPSGIRAILAVEKQIIELEIAPAKKIQHSGDPDGKPIASEVTHRVVFENYAQ